MTEAANSDAAGADVAASATSAPDLPILATPADGLPALVDTPARLAEAISSLARGTGPVAIDTERAQGFRYSGRAYLIQLRRAGSGTHLVDPSAFLDDAGVPNLSELGAAIAEAEWIVHAATQDLPCLAEAKMLPQRLFDTELAGRLLGLPRVGLGALIEAYFGQRLLKEHSAADWSRRPIPEEWLNYAALDVELLIPLRDLLADELSAAGKDEWARQEFATLAMNAGQPAPERVDRWRRTSRITDVRSRRGLGIVKEIWLERDALARRLDRAPGRLVQDAAITEFARMASDAKGSVLARNDLRKVGGFNRRTARQYEPNWWAAVERAQSTPAPLLPPLRAPLDGPPMPRSWARRHPEAAQRWETLRPLANSVAEGLSLPPENLISPDVLRRFCWEPVTECGPDTTTVALLDQLNLERVTDRLLGLGARAWQAEIVAEKFLEGLRNPPVASGHDADAAHE